MSNRAKTILGAILIMVVFSTIFGGCESNKKTPDSSDGKIKVITTIFPLYDFVNQVGGENVFVEVLLPPGTEPHHFEPSPNDIISVTKASVFVFTNDAMEPWAKKVADIAGENGAKILNASEGITFRSDDEGIDPHVWLTPGNAIIIANNIKNVLSQLMPEKIDEFDNNLKIFSERMNKLDNDIKSAVLGFDTKQVYFAGHSAFGYFAAEYGLEFVSPYKGFSTEAEPSASSIEKMISGMKDMNVKYLYFEELVDPKTANTISDQTGATLLVLNAAHNIEPGDLEKKITYEQIMRENIANLQKGLGK